ncbi:MAG: thiolase family protein [Candidatus Humimicrobiaceae bacterium]
MNIKGKVAIVGYGETEFVKKNPGDRTNLTEQCRAAKFAIEDAGIKKDDIDGLIALSPLDEGPTWAEDLAEYLQLHPRYIDSVYRGGAAGNAGILYASAAIAAGICSTVLIVAGQALDISQLYKFGLENGVSFERDFDTIYGPMFNNSAYALIKQRYMYEFNATDEQFAQVVINARYHSSKFSNALLKNSVTVEDVLNSRMICDPLHLFEIVMPCIGGCALIITSSDRAKEMRNPPVYLLGGGQSIDRGLWNPAYGYNPSITTSPIKLAAEQAFQMAGLTINDMDFAQLYDCYTITVIIALEDIGCCKKGEGANFVVEKDLTFRGEMPLNTDGGQLGRGQPTTGGHLIPSIESARQLMGRAGNLQVKDAKFGLANGNGGSMADQCVLIFGNEIP